MSDYNYPTAAEMAASATTTEKVEESIAKTVGRELRRAKGAADLGSVKIILGPTPLIGTVAQAKAYSALAVSEAEQAGYAARVYKRRNCGSSSIILEVSWEADRRFEDEEESLFDAATGGVLKAV